MFLQVSDIPSTFCNVSHVSAKVKEFTSIRLPTRTSTEDNDTSRTQIVEPALGFTPVEIHHTQTEPKLTVKKLLEIESCNDYIKTLIQTLDGIYVALHGTPGVLGVPWLWCSCFTAVLGNFVVGALQMWHV